MLLPEVVHGLPEVPLVEGRLHPVLALHVRDVIGPAIMDPNECDLTLGYPKPGRGLATLLLGMGPEFRKETAIKENTIRNSQVL